MQWNDIVHQPFAFRKDRVLRHEEDCNQLERANLEAHFPEALDACPGKGRALGHYKNGKAYSYTVPNRGYYAARYSYRRSNRDAVAAGVAERSAVPWAPWPSRHTAPTSVRRMATRPSPFLQRRILLRRRLLSARLHGKPVAWPELSPAALARASRCRRRDHQRRCRARL